MTAGTSPIAARPGPAFALAVGLGLANFFAHKPISDICDALFERLGRASYEAAALAGIGAGCGLIAGLLLRWRGPTFGARESISILGLGALTVVAQQWLLVSNIELVHFPQFALFAALLLWGGVAPLPAWWIATAAGGVDELYQHLVIYRGVAGTYLDFNDMFLNGIGAAWGVLLWPAGALTPGQRRPATTILRAGGLLLLWLVVLWLDPPRLDPLLDRALSGRAYRLLTAAEMLAGLALVWMLLSTGLRREPPGGSPGSEAVAPPQAIDRARAFDPPGSLLE